MLCRKWDVIAITDEIYEHIIYEGQRHILIASLEGMADRTVTINSMSKTYSVTGWRVGWTISPPSSPARFARSTTSDRWRGRAAAGSLGIVALGA